MDFQRIFIFMGLAVTGYMLILAWQQDYGRNAPADSVTFESAVSENRSAMPQETPAQVVSDVPDVDALRGAADARLPILESTTMRTIAINTDVLNVKIDLNGGDIVFASLPDYPANIEEPDNPLILIDPKNQYSAQSGLIGPDGLDKSGIRPQFTATRSVFTLRDSDDELQVRLSLAIPFDDRLIEKIYTFKRGDYLVDVRYEVQNIGLKPLEMAFFGQIKRDGRPPLFQVDNAMGLQPYLGIATRNVDERYSKIDLDDVQEAPYQLDFTGGYIAFLQHYFVGAWAPPQNEAARYYARSLQVAEDTSSDVYLLGYTAALTTINTGGQQTFGGSFYIGPKDQTALAQIAEGLDLTVDYGFLWFIAQPLFVALTFIHEQVNNWGIAIILLTVLVKTLLYPLSAASFRSMAKMRKLQPEMVRLKERYGDDRQKFSQAMMEMYKKEGANPLGGCLPILLQMPVFLALYWTLMESVELRHAPFIFWIKDLSVMDPYFVLPILMGISMYLTQMMQPEPPDPVQAKVFKFMPIIFTVFFLWFPSGLVLYWLVNNILSVLQQLYVTRQLENAR